MQRFGVATRVPVTTLEHLAGDGGAHGLEGVAEALLGSPSWSTVGDVVMVLRYDPFPVLAVVGDVDAAAAARLDALRDQLVDVGPTIRVLDHVAVDVLVRQLADHILARLGHREVTRASFAAIPRGGHLVLGSLAYALHLDPDQLEPGHHPEGHVVVVDDVARSGARLRRWLDAHAPDRPVTVAHLLSTPGLRRAVEDGDRRVTACVAGGDLRDLAPERLGAGYTAWRRRWAGRSPEAYWVGEPAPVSFPWQEPHRTVWNPVTETPEPGWRLVPPDRSAGNRPPEGLRARAIQVQLRGPGPIRPADDVVAADLGGGVVIVASADRGDAVRLDGVAADLWHALCAAGDVPAAVALLERWYDVDPGRLAADLEDVVTQLQADGLVVDGRHAEVVQLFGSDFASRRTASATAVTTRSLKTDGTM